MAFKGSEKLKKEINSWLSEGLIDEQQAEALKQRYELDRPAPWYKRSGFILRSVAALLFALSLLLIISENWQDFGIIVQSAVGMLPLLAAYGLGIYYFIKNKKEAAEITFFFASLAFGANIFLQAQIFHIGAYYPDGIKWWLIGAVPFAVYFRSNLHNFQLQVLFLIWLSSQYTYEHFSLWALPVYGVMGWLLWKRFNAFQTLLFIINTYLLFFNISQLFSRYDESLILFGTLSYLIAIVLQFIRQKDKKLIDRLTVMMHLFVLSLLYLMTFKELNAHLFEERQLPWTSLTLFVLGIIIAFTRYKHGWWYWITGIMAWVFATLFLGLLFQHDLQRYAGTIAILSNLLAASYITWLIVRGIQSQQKKRFMAGTFLLLLLIATRYFDLFENYLVTALIFGLSGILLLMANHYWNKRYEEI